jgi:hypothetical protein
MSLIPLTNKTEIANTYRAMVRSLRSGAHTYRRTVGWRGGNDVFALHWHPKHHFWVVFSVGDFGGYWCPFGVADPTVITTASITCEINPPNEGVNRREGGVFLKDPAGEVYLAHIGKVAGGRKGIGKSAFFDTYSGKVKKIGRTVFRRTSSSLDGSEARHSCATSAATSMPVEDFKANITTGAPVRLKQKNYPALLPIEPPVVRAYPREAVIAEKLEAMV